MAYGIILERSKQSVEFESEIDRAEWLEENCKFDGVWFWYKSEKVFCYE